MWALGYGKGAFCHLFLSLFRWIGSTNATKIERTQIKRFVHENRMPQKRLPKQAFLPKEMGKDQSDDLELDLTVTLRIWDGIAWGFTQAKRWMWWKTVKCGGLISSCCPRNPHRKTGKEERRRRPYLGNKALFLKCNKVVQIQNCGTVLIMKHIDLRRYVAMRKCWLKNFKKFQPHWSDSNSFLLGR